MKSVKTCLAAAVLGLACAVASADMVSYAFTGNVSYDEADRGYQGFVGSFSFDRTATNQIVDPSGSTGSYTGAGAAWSMNLSFDGGAVLDFGSQGFHVNVMNNLGGYDWLGLLGSGGDGTVSAGLYDFTMALFGNAGLPLRDGGYTLADFGWSDFSWESGAGLLQGMFTSLNCTAGCSATNPGGDPGGNPGGGNPGGGSNTVPEPSSLLLAVSGLWLLLRRRRG
ncbi:MAG TPA: PEP-CTERM sorting domain-containing protein [Roseateles sp.]|uniref:PEP-CTERM sorting domain-containing protein n=1 Tax=Roseateles sp. TaxID=1971397 RepID=UPI002ED9B03E